MGVGEWWGGNVGIGEKWEREWKREWGKEWGSGGRGSGGGSGVEERINVTSHSSSCMFKRASQSCTHADTPTHRKIDLHT